MAVVDIVMPKMGESIMDGRILKWFKQPGDKVERDETLFEISTDKVDTEVPSAEGGILVELLYNEGDTANVGEVVARIETDAANANVKTGVTKQETKEEPKAETKPEPAAVKQEEKKTEAPKAPAGDSKSGSGAGFYSPLVLTIAQKEGISMDELSSISGTGVGGRVRKQDVLAYIEDRKSGKPTKTAEKDYPGMHGATQGGTKEPATAKAVVAEKKPVEYKAPELHKSIDLTNLYNMPGVDVVPMDTLQSKMAEHMVMSIHTSPHVAA
ncbi:MAG TPA: E3 binding domain-containing protein, partial [Ignavibacteria bacterium]|nr:E3 binding domain-containing protein [Ignavibacteria bacterium]